MWPFKKKKKERKFMEYESFEEFKKALIMYTKQDLALEDNRSYFELQDNLFGEMFDNGMRLKFLKENNPDFYAQINEEEIKAEAKKQYEQDKNEE